MGTFTEYLSQKNDIKLWIEKKMIDLNQYLEMAVIGDYAKTPILFDKDDIMYLYQFPPRFWKTALIYRYNKLLLEAKKAQEEGKQYPDQQKVSFNLGKGTYTFDVNTGINKLLEKLEKDKDLDHLSKLEKDQKHTYQAGHYGYDLSKVQFHPEDDDQNFTNGYVAMSKQTAQRALASWREALNSGWLGNINQFPKQKVAIGGGGKGKGEEGGVTMPILPRDVLNKFFDPSRITPDHKVTFHYLDTKGKPKTEESYVPVLLPGKMISSRAYKKHKALLQSAEDARKEGNLAQHKELLAQAQQLQDETPKHTPIDWNIHRYNYTPDPDNPSGKVRKYPRLHTDTMKFGGFSPNSQQAEQLVSGDEDWKLLEPFIIGDYRGDTYYSKSVTPDGEVHYTKYNPTQKGVTRFLKSKEGEYEYYVLNSMFDDLVQSSILELKSQLRDPSVQKFLKALKAGDADGMGKYYGTMVRKIQNHAFNFAQRVGQLNWGRGTRRKRKAASDGIISIQQSMSKGEGEGKGVLDIAKSYINRLSTLGVEEGDREIGARKWRTAGGLGSEEEIYFGHNLANLKANLAKLTAAKQSSAQGDTKQELMAERDVRKEIFDQLWSLYIATKIKLNKPWSIADANKYADENLQKVLQKRGIKVSKAPQEILDSMSDRKDASKAASRASQEAQDKAEILAAVGRGSEVSDADDAEQKIFNPETISMLKNNPVALQNLEKTMNAETDPYQKNQMRKIIDRIKGEMGIQQPQSIAAKTQAPDVVQNQPIEPANIRFNTPALIARLKANPEELNKVKSNEKLMNNPVWQDIVRQAQQ